MTQQQPSVGRIAHYVSHGTPPRADGTQAYTSRCVAAIITDVGGLPEIEEQAGRELDSDAPVAGLCVFNPAGLFFQHVAYDAGGGPGTWHWPERVGP